MGSSHSRAGRDPERPDILHAEFDWTVVPPSLAVVRTLAVAAGCEPTELPPLIEFIDPDAVDRLFQQPTGAERRLSLTFQMCDYSVTVTEAGDVFVHTAPERP